MIYAILNGGDWADASVNHLVLPDDIDIEKEAIDKSYVLREYGKGFRN